MNLRKITLLILSIVMCFALVLGVVGCNETDNPSSDSVNSVGSNDPTSSDKGGSTSSQETSLSEQKSDSNDPTTSSGEPTSDSEDPTTSSGEPTSDSEDPSTSSGGDDPKPVEEIVEVLDVKANKNFTLFQTNKGEKDNKQTEFYDRTQELTVGDDNAFVVMPEVQFIKITDNIPEAFVPEEWNYVITVSRYTEQNTYVELNDADLATFVDKIDAKNATVDFSTEAIGNKFKISVYPEGTDTSDIADFTKSIEVVVVDAYNVYTANELAYIENGTRQDEKRDGVWAEFKKTNGLTAEAKAGIVLQANVSITKENLPSYFFYQKGDAGVVGAADEERVVGSLKDYENLYERHLSGSEQFIIIGNYFTIDCASLPVVVRPGWGVGEIITDDRAYESHSSLTMFQHKDNGEENKTRVEMKNINFIGNAPRVEDTSKTGGIILGKSQVETLMYNNISNNFFITFFPEVSRERYTIQKCKSYNAYSCFVYVWGSNDVHIDESEFNSAGGPVIIADHVTDERDMPSSVTVTNSELHSYVTGQEAWFQMYQATNLTSQIFAMNSAFTPLGRSFLKTRGTGSEMLQFMDFVAFYKSGDTNGMTSIKITGNYVQDGAEPLDFGTYTNPWNGFDKVDQTNPKSMFIEGIWAQYPTAPIFMTSGGGMSFLNPQVGLMQLDQTGTPVQIKDPQNAMFSGKQLYLYYTRMGIVLNYFNAGETI